MYNGIINVYKEAGFTSHDVVAKLRGILKQKKIGHTGTLDPDAVGVLPICLGKGTRLCDFLTEKDKEYVAVLRLGTVTDTQDATGMVLYEKPVRVDEEEVKEAIHSFQGKYAQIPPMYSALKVNGKKLYEIARAGGEIERKPRMIEIMEIEIIKMDLPEVKIRIVCGKGTYVRTLCHDIGDKLGCGGLMASLERTQSGEFSISDALTLVQIEKLAQADKISTVIKSIDSVFLHLRAVTVLSDFVNFVKNGNRLRLSQIVKTDDFFNGEKVRIYDENGIFYAIYGYEGEGSMKAIKMFYED